MSIYHHYKNGSPAQKDLVSRMMESIGRFANTVRGLRRAAERFGELLEVEPRVRCEIPRVLIGRMMYMLGELLQGVESRRMNLSRLQHFCIGVTQGLVRQEGLHDGDADRKRQVREWKSVLVDLGGDLEDELHRIASLQDRLLASPPARDNPYIIIRNPGPAWATDDSGWLMAARRITEPEYGEVEVGMAGLALA